MCNTSPLWIPKGHLSCGRCAGDGTIPHTCPSCDGAGFRQDPNYKPPPPPAPPARAPTCDPLAVLNQVAKILDSTYNSETMRNMRRVEAMVEKQFKAAPYHLPALEQSAHQSNLATALSQWLSKSN